jgi:hypothetical protein
MFPQFLLKYFDFEARVFGQYNAAQQNMDITFLACLSLDLRTLERTSAVFL